MDRIVKPTVAEMARRGTPYHRRPLRGPDDRGWRTPLVEYNVRFGDPECQVLMMRLGGQALDLMLACAEGRLSEMTVNWAPDHAMTVVLAANGYPGSLHEGNADPRPRRAARGRVPHDVPRRHRERGR
jgi:phosphoribosylamine--glycine ligase